MVTILIIILWIIEIPYMIFYIVIGVLGIIPHFSDLMDNLIQGGSLDLSTIKKFIFERMPWFMKIGDTPESIKILGSLVIWFYILY